MKNIHLWGVRQNNLKDIEVDIPIGSFTVVCGPSGSGKSSLAFETLYAEGQRRFFESLSNYSKQFLNKAPKPDIQGVENIPPAISIEQKNSVKSSRSTVGTTTEVVDYLRLLYEKLGQAFCPEHHLALERDSISEGADKILALFEGERGYILAPIPAENRLLSGKKFYDQLIKDGILRIYCPAKTAESEVKASRRKGKSAQSGSTKKVLAQAASDSLTRSQLTPFFQGKLGEVLELSDGKFKRYGPPKDEFYLVIDRLAFRSEERGRIIDSLSHAYSASLKYNNERNSGRALIASTEGKHLFVSEDLSCSICSYSFPRLTSRMFSFNSPLGACPKCKGFGNLLELDIHKVIPNFELSLSQGALTPFTMPSAAKDRQVLFKYCNKMGISLHTPWKDLPSEQKKLVWEGSKDFFGVTGLFEYLETKKYKMHIRVFLSRYKSAVQCSTCKGTRLKPEIQQVLIEGKSISDLCAMTVSDLLQHLHRLRLSPSQKEICEELHQQLLGRLSFLRDVGVGYMTMDRPTRTLSGGEYQRLNLANQLGMGLSQTLYVLDEPTVGLHPRDNDKLIDVLKRLNELGNTLVVVEHDHDVIRNASHIIEMGPGSGHLGGEILFSGNIRDFYHFDGSNTLPYLKGADKWILEKSERPIEPKSYQYKIEVTGCTGNNLKNVDLSIPLHRIVTVTGVSGSGKSSLITNTLYPALARTLGVEYLEGLPFKELRGDNFIKGVLMIDQSPIGKTARSNPVTYLKVYDHIRSLFANTPEAKALGLTAGAFSLNVDGGRCPVCKGLGHEVVDMIFMDDLEIPCDACDRKKFRPEILEILFKDRNIHQILEMTVAEAMDFFVSFPNIRRPLSVLREVGLEYLRLGQNANSLSGGESQRLKIAREFNSTSQKSTLYILDEPTTGLHFREVHLLLGVLNRLVESGGSVLLIEHNLEVIRHSDWVIDMGPEAGIGGGDVIAAATPDELTKSLKGYTGRYLKHYMDFIHRSEEGKMEVVPSTSKAEDLLSS
ncbi:MAG: excinuclease ABC subunit UvrA [Bdellovibrionales bacterium]|nr:excinuclease ABC subunit UvrA [Bdellovibrionales bacterium]